MRLCAPPSHSQRAACHRRGRPPIARRSESGLPQQAAWSIQRANRGWVGVVPLEVVSAGDGWSAAEGAVGSVVVVVA
jgi:hypothetical protein